LPFVATHPDHRGFAPVYSLMENEFENEEMMLASGRVRTTDNAGIAVGGGVLSCVPCDDAVPKGEPVVAVAPMAKRPCLGWIEKEPHLGLKRSHVFLHDAEEGSEEASEDEESDEAESD
jgi:hypothetical protein